jgi:hypothetical protein
VGQRARSESQGGPLSGSTTRAREKSFSRPKGNASAPAAMTAEGQRSERALAGRAVAAPILEVRAPVELDATFAFVSQVGAGALLKGHRSHVRMDHGEGTFLPSSGIEFPRARVVLPERGSGAAGSDPIHALAVRLLRLEREPELLAPRLLRIRSGLMRVCALFAGGLRTYLG